MTLYELFKDNDNGFDVSDNVFDFGVYYGYDLNEKNDYFDLLLDYIAKNVEVEKIQLDWYTICGFTKFIEKHQKELDKFLNEYYLEEYTPKYLAKKYGLSKISVDTDGELFYDIYFEFLEALIIGNVSTNGYEKLYKLFTEKKQQKKGGKKNA